MSAPNHLSVDLNQCNGCAFCSPFQSFLQTRFVHTSHFVATCTRSHMWFSVMIADTTEDLLVALPLLSPLLLLLLDTAQIYLSTQSSLLNSFKSFRNLCKWFLLYWSLIEKRAKVNVFIASRTSKLKRLRILLCIFLFLSSLLCVFFFLLMSVYFTLL